MPDGVPPHFVIRNKFQKGGLYEDVLTPDILHDVCNKATGRGDYTHEFVDEINVGRLAILSYNGENIYITFSVRDAGGRNSSFQSLSAALCNYILDNHHQKLIYYYFLPDLTGNFDTPYFIFMHRLLRTAGVKFLNNSPKVLTPILPFTTAEDIVVQKEKLRGRGKGNNSTYVTKGQSGTVQIYGKTYGASKYETTLLCIGIGRVTIGHVQLFQVGEGGLTVLPAKALAAIALLGNVSIVASDLQIEANEFQQNDSLRSVRFIYNLLEKFGKKKCAFCECELPEIIQGAHIWPVASIKQADHLPLDNKLAAALDGHNGLWLCENHHKLLDTGTLFLAENGIVKCKEILCETDRQYVAKITTNIKLSAEYLHADFLGYLSERNLAFEARGYTDIAA